MKRILFIIMAVIAIFMVVAGIVESQSWHGDTPGAHIASAMIFILLLIIHIIVQRKAVWRYFTGAVKLPSDPRQKRRQITCRVTVYLMLIFGLLTIISAIIENDSSGIPVFHVVMASLFVLFFVRHLVANRKTIANYFITGKKEPVVRNAADIEDFA